MPPLLRAGREPIPRTAHGLNEAIVPEFFERLTKAPDVHIDRALLDIDVAAPDAIEELVALVHPLRVRHEELEHAVFGGAERHRLVAHEHAMARLVERESLEFDALVAVVGRGPAQHRIDASDQLARREGL